MPDTNNATTPQSQLNTDQNQPLIKAYLDLKGVSSIDALGESHSVFFNQILEDYDAEELPDIAPEVMADLIASFWEFGTKRVGEGDLLAPSLTIRPFNSSYDVLFIVQKDAPFIVESVMGELMDQGFNVRSMFHPVLRTYRSVDGLRQEEAGEPIKESMMMVVVSHDSPERHANLTKGILETLSELGLAVVDFGPMQNLLAKEIATLERLHQEKRLKIDDGLFKENIAFLKWVDANHFVFLGAKGYIYPRDEKGGYLAEAPLDHIKEGYGVLRDTSRPVLRDSNEPAVLSKQLLNQLEHTEPVTIAKANLKSLVHRRVSMDYIGIKRYGEDGKPSGEVRFVGLFTAEAYDRPVMEVPLIRRKAETVLTEATRLGFSHGGYNEKRLKNILETYPRDELFQISEDDLLRISRGILHISDRPRVRLFARTDHFDRFISILLFMPREAYQESIRQKAGEGLANAYGGKLLSSYPNLTGSLLSSIHYIITVTPGDHYQPDLTVLENEIEALSQSWPQKFIDAKTVEPNPEGIDFEDGTIAWSDWAMSFPLSYQDRFDLREALIDTYYLAKLSPEEPINVRAYQRFDDTERMFCFKLYTRAKRAIPLSDILPILENMGLKTLEEFGFSLKTSEAGQYWVHEFILRRPETITIDFQALKDSFVGVMMALRRRQTEDDRFNSLVLLGLDWREMALLRALCRYRQQSGLDPSLEVQQSALLENPEVTKGLLSLFKARFDLASLDFAVRQDQVTALSESINERLQSVSSLEHDRVLRRLLALIMAILRTNYYQTDLEGKQKHHISFKIASCDLIDLPNPKPYREIFVWSPLVEGVHLRFGPVARGGLRWSDRREDFRTEVLGLVKAQQVKNAVIVPVGSKGGFYPKALPKNGSAEEVRAEAIKAYKIFLSGLLDLTDNIDANNEIVAPKEVVTWDKPDPYLVVAADKGTATFSDIANGVARDYGFWLDDAFASGGSVGYDHKAMGITAKGAWEAVKRHFRERGKDIQSESFTVAGVGDMSGDVFGNGMLLSKQIKLVAAFDHRDIFLDPNPEPQSSFEERLRVFNLPRSSWNDYDKNKISTGGGVFSRSLKSIPVSPEIAKVLDIEAGALSPFELMQAILKAPVELLYFGGIGTYIKAGFQTHVEVGDKANDAIRIDAAEVRAQVVGEGANLGLTQVGRIELAERGVSLNTDAIDNSAGVDCSDHEVNIKILLGALISKGDLKPENRDALLAQMTDAVSELVLKDNYDQTLALSLAQGAAVEDNLAIQSFLTELENRGRLDRKVEDLPKNTIMEQRRKLGHGLYRPELAVVMAYAKIVLFDDIIASDAPDDQGFEPLLINYFPQDLAGYKDAILSHRLHREIIATVLCNDLVNMVGPSFVKRLGESADVTIATAVKSFEAVRRLFGLNTLWQRVHALDNQISSDAQMRLYEKIVTFARHQTYWMARRFANGGATLDAMTTPFISSVQALMNEAGNNLTVGAKSKLKQRIDSLVSQGAPDDLATQIALLPHLHQSMDVIDLAQAHTKDVVKTAELYYLCGQKFGFDTLCAGAGSLSSTDPWDRMATRRLIEDVRIEQKSVVKMMMQTMTLSQSPEDIISNWERDHQERLLPLNKLLQTFTNSVEDNGANLSFAKLTIVNARLREWVSRL